MKLFGSSERFIFYFFKEEEKKRRTALVEVEVFKGVRIVQKNAHGKIRKSMLQ